MPAHVLHSLRVQGFALKGSRHLNWSASLSSGGVKDRSLLRIAPRTNNNLCLLVQVGVSVRVCVCCAHFSRSLAGGCGTSNIQVSVSHAAELS